MLLYVNWFCNMIEVSALVCRVLPASVRPSLVACARVLSHLAVKLTMSSREMSLRQAQTFVSG